MSNGESIASRGAEDLPGGPDQMLVNIGSLRCAQSGPLSNGRSIQWRVLDKNLKPVKKFAVLPLRWGASPLATGSEPIPGKDGLTAPITVTAPPGRSRTEYKFAIRIGGPGGTVHTSKEAYLVI